MTYIPPTILAFATTTALLAAFPANALIPASVITSGRTVAGDGGGAQFWYNASDTTTADNGGTIRVDAQNRRWYAKQSIISPLLFGAGGAGATNDAPAVLAAATYLSGIGGGTILVDRIYSMASTFFPNLSNIRFAGAGGKIISRLPVLSPNPYGPLHFQTCSNIVFDGVEVDGDYPAFASSPSGAQLNNFCIVFASDCVNCRVVNCYIHDSGCNNGADHAGDGIYITGTGAGPYGIIIANNLFKDCARWAVTVLAGSSVTIENNTNIHNSTVPALGFIDVEPGAGAAVCSNISIIGNNSRGPSLITMDPFLTPGFANIVIANNTLDFTYPDTGGVVSSTAGIALFQAENATIQGNQIFNSAGDLIHAANLTGFTISGNSAIQGSATASNGLFMSACSDGVVSNNYIAVDDGSVFGMQITNLSSTVVTGNYVSNPSNWGINASVADTHCAFLNNYLVGAATVACGIAGNACVFSGNISAQSGRLDASAHTVMGNAMSLDAGGAWQTAGGQYRAPDFAFSRNQLSMSAEPAAGAWTQGDFVFNSQFAVAAGKVLLGWSRLTTGSGNVDTVDWQAVYVST